MAEHRLPEWIDRRTAEWCAQLCDSMSARMLAHWPAAQERRVGMEAAARTIRAVVMTGKPALPALIPDA